MQVSTIQLLVFALRDLGLKATVELKHVDTEKQIFHLIRMQGFVSMCRSEEEKRHE